MKTSGSLSVNYLDTGFISIIYGTKWMRFYLKEIYLLLWLKISDRNDYSWQSTKIKVKK